MQETQIRSLGWEDALEEEMATHSSILACRIPWTEKPGGLQSMGSQRVGHHLLEGQATIRGATFDSSELVAPSLRENGKEEELSTTTLDQLWVKTGTSSVQFSRSVVSDSL